MSTMFAAGRAGHLACLGQASVPALFPTSSGTGAVNYLAQPSTFGNDLSLTKRVRIFESKDIEFRISAYNAFNNARRSSTNAAISFKANGANWSDGFTVYNTPQQIVDRLPAQSRTTPRQVFDAWRGEVGLVNLTTVDPNRIVEIGMRFRF